MTLSMRWVVTLIVSVVMFSSGACYVEGMGFDKDIQKTFDVKEGGTLFVDTDIGSIQVESGSGNIVDIHVYRTAKSSSETKAEKILNDFNIEFRQQGNDVYVTAEYKKGRRLFSWMGNRLRVKYVIKVPRVYNAELRTSGGSVSVADLEGKVSSRTSGGSLKFGDIKGPVYGRTSGGSITVKGCEGRSEVKTSGGSITLGHMKGNVLAHTSGGGIRVEEVLGSINARTSGGSIKATISKQPSEDCRLTTSGGSITVHLIAGIKLDLDAKTSGGRVRTEFPVTVRGEISRRSLRAQLNGGGPDLYLRTSGGSIILREL